ncbi:glycosyltransferase family 1 protein [Paenibacillus albicereus]|uniref:Glycosyltransferase family 1 protein n=1 Tax=Paenibacillus albicereus TaxID=2726185 RepID=A0A6H2H3R9_9BACL|nr:glycosyltransferase family 1 protein [Paenibacillus albicereus]QJC53988.1 glycosyltransferase family 1 protein [Paenibacillus albicereus]
MRLALFTDTFAPQMNDVARTLGRLTAHLERRGIEHLVFAPASPEEASPPLALHPPPLSLRPSPSVPFLLYPECRLALPNVLSMRQQLDRFRPDLLHLATPFNIGLCGLRYARRRGLPHAASYHTHFDRYFSYYGMAKAVPLYWRYIRWFHRSCGATFAPSRETLLALYRQGVGGLRLWTRGVDSERFHPAKRRAAAVRERFGIAPDERILLYVGRIAPEKDVATLAELLRGLPASREGRARWLVVGDGPALPELKAGAPDGAIFAGYREGEELAELYASADLFVFPSSTETFGNVALEAMASGLPVIGADAGGIRESVRHEATGLLCPPGDAAAFAAAIERLAASPDEARRMGEEGRKHALSQSWEAILDDLLDQYGEVIERSRHARAADPSFGTG